MKKTLESIVWQFTDQRGVVLHEYTVTRTVWHLADGTFRTTALGSRGKQAFRVQMVDLFGRSIDALRQELPPSDATAKLAKWVILDERGKLFGPFDEPMFARDWFERRTSLTAGRYVVLPLEAV